MTGKLNIDFNDILKEIEQLTNENPDGFSITEMAENLKRPKAWFNFKGFFHKKKKALENCRTFSVIRHRRFQTCKTKWTNFV